MNNELKYGCIIRINSNNLDYNGKVFFINYINNKKIELLSNKGDNLIEINITDDGVFDDETINNIEILYCPPEGMGYAEINGLKTGKYIEITLDAEVREVLTGEIISTEQDMVEVRLVNDHVKDQVILLISTMVVLTRT